MKQKENTHPHQVDVVIWLKLKGTDDEQILSSR